MGSVTDEWVQVFVNSHSFFLCNYFTKSAPEKEWNKLQIYVIFSLKPRGVGKQSTFEAARQLHQVQYLLEKVLGSSTSTQRVTVPCQVLADRMWPKLLDTAPLTHLMKTNGTLITTNIDLEFFLICLFMLSQGLCLCIQTTLWELEKDYTSTLR